MFSPSTNITKIDESIQKLKSKIQREGTQNTDVIRYVGNFLKKNPSYGEWIHSHQD